MKLPSLQPKSVLVGLTRLRRMHVPANQNRYAGAAAIFPPKYLQA